MDAKPGQTVFISGGTGSLGDGYSGCQEPGLTVATNGNGENEDVCALGADIFIDRSRATRMSCRTLTWCSIHSRRPRAKAGLNSQSREAAARVAAWHAQRPLRSTHGHALVQLIPSCPSRAASTDAMTARKKQTYDFIFVHEDGAQLERIASLSRPSAC